MAKKKTKKAVKKSEDGATRKKKHGKKRAITRRDVIDQDASDYVIFEDAEISGGGLGPIQVTVLAKTLNCNSTQSSIDNFRFTATLNGYDAYDAYRTAIDTYSATLTFKFFRWVDDMPSFFFTDELVITVLTKKKVKTIRA
jgi:hypothetical protein